MSPAPVPDLGPWDATLEAWVASLSSDNTRTAYRADLLKFAEWCLSRQLSPLRATSTEVTEYQRFVLATGASGATARRRSSSLSSFFEFAIDVGAVDMNPVLGAQRAAMWTSSSSAALTDDDVSTIVSAASGFDPRAAALVLLLAFDGLRLNEALSLDTDDVSLGGSEVPTIELIRSGRASSHVLDPRSVDAVARCVDGRPGQPLFLSQRGLRLSRFGADHLLKRIPAAGDTPLTADALRRYFVATA